MKESDAGAASVIGTILLLALVVTAAVIVSVVVVNAVTEASYNGPQTSLQVSETKTKMYNTGGETVEWATTRIYMDEGEITDYCWQTDYPVDDPKNVGKSLKKAGTWNSGQVLHLYDSAGDAVNADYVAIIATDGTKDFLLYKGKLYGSTKPDTPVSEKYFWIYYDKNDTAATGSTSSTKIHVGSSGSINSCGFALTKGGQNYQFQGWSVSPDSTVVSYNPGQSYYAGSEGSMTLYAVWKVEEAEKKYKVTYDANGASGTCPTDSAEYSKGATVSVKSASGLTKGSDEFGGWVSSADGKTYNTDDADASNDSFTITQDVTLTAQWIARYTVTYKADDADNPDKCPTDSNSPYVYDADVTVLADDASGTALVRDGYKFAGWVSSVDDVVYKAGDTFKIFKDVVLTAKWESDAVTTITLRVEKEGATQINSAEVTAAGTKTAKIKEGDNVVTGESGGDFEHLKFVDIANYYYSTVYRVDGYYTEPYGGGVQVLDKNGQLIVSDDTKNSKFVDADGKWCYSTEHEGATTLDLYVKWVYNVRFYAILLDNSVENYADNILHPYVDKTYVYGVAESLIDPYDYINYRSSDGTTYKHFYRYGGETIRGNTVYNSYFCGWMATGAVKTHIPFGETHTWGPASTAADTTYGTGKWDQIPPYPQVDLSSYGVGSLAPASSSVYAASTENATVSGKRGYVVDGALGVSLYAYWMRADLNWYSSYANRAKLTVNYYMSDANVAKYNIESPQVRQYFIFKVDGQVDKMYAPEWATDITWYEKTTSGGTTTYTEYFTQSDADGKYHSGIQSALSSYKGTDNSLVINLYDSPDTSSASESTFTINFNPNGGTLDGSTATKSYTTDSSGKLKSYPTSDPVRSGYTFGGWEYYPEGSSKSTVITTRNLKNAQFTSSVTLTAKWTRSGGR